MTFQRLAFMLVCLLALRPLTGAAAPRVITLAPHATELVYAAGAGNTLVGVVEYSDYPAESSRLPRIGNATRLDFERILTLRPDIAIAWRSGNRPADLARLEELGIRLYLSEPRKLEDIAREVIELGELLGNEAAATTAAGDFMQQLTRLRQQPHHHGDVSVFYQVWPQPLITVGADHIISDIITLCGGRNIFGDLVDLAPPVSVEAVLQRNPSVIIAARDATQVDALAQWRRFPRLAAVKSGRLVSVPVDLIHRPTPRILAGAEQICDALRSSE